MTETLEVIPRRWKVIETVRETFTCRGCEKLSQPPAPYHAVPRGWAGPNLLATVVLETPDNDHTGTPTTMSIDGLFFQSVPRPSRRRRTSSTSP